MDTQVEANYEWIESVCERLRKVDTSLVNHIENLTTSDKTDFINALREYVQAVKSFQSCIEQDKDKTKSLAKDILEEEGPRFYYIYDPEHIQDVLNLDEPDLDECNRLHKEAVDIWVEIDKMLSDTN